MLRGIWTREENKLVDEQITKVLEAMNDAEPTSEEYSDLIERLERLKKMRTGDRSRRFSWDTLLVVGGNLLLGFGIVAYENKHVISSKAWNQQIRPEIPKK